MSIIARDLNRWNVWNRDKYSGCMPEVAPSVTSFTEMLNYAERDHAGGVQRSSSGRLERVCAMYMEIHGIEYCHERNATRTSSDSFAYSDSDSCLPASAGNSITVDKLLTLDEYTDNVDSLQMIKIQRFLSGVLHRAYSSVEVGNLVVKTEPPLQPAYKRSTGIFRFGQEIKRKISLRFYRGVRGFPDIDGMQNQRPMK